MPFVRNETLHFVDQYSVTIDREHTEASKDRANLYSIAKLELVILFVELSDALRVEIRSGKACSREIPVRGALGYRYLVVTNAFTGIPLNRVAVPVYVFQRVGELLLSPLRR